MFAVAEELPGVDRRLRQIIHTHADHTDGAGLEFGRTTPFGAMTLHVVHVAMETGLKPLIKTCFRCAEIGVGNGHLLETEFISPLADLRGEHLRVEMVLCPAHSRYDTCHEPITL